MLEFDNNGCLIIPVAIERDLEDQNNAKNLGLTLSQFRQHQYKSEKQVIRNLHETEVLQEIMKHAEHGKNQKFTDNELSELHERGFSDVEIAKVYRCHPTSVWLRRCKLAKVANFPAPYGRENLNEVELRDRYDTKMHKK